MPISDSNGYPLMTMNKSALIGIWATLPDYFSRGENSPCLIVVQSGFVTFSSIYEFCSNIYPLFGIVPYPLHDSCAFDC